MKLKKQKYIIISILFLINSLLSVTFIIYPDKWYVYLFILALASIINSLNTIMILINKLLIKTDQNKVYRSGPVNLVYLVPCYNESQTELTDTLDSLCDQITTQPEDKKLIVIICDGKVKGLGNNKKTNKILTEVIFNNNNKNVILDAYKTWDNSYNDLDIYTGKYKNLDYILMIDFIIIKLNI